MPASLKVTFLYIKNVKFQMSSFARFYIFLFVTEHSRLLAKVLQMLPHSLKRKTDVATTTTKRGRNFSEILTGC